VNDRRITRRTLLADGTGALIGATALHNALSGKTRPRYERFIDLTEPRADQLEALRVLGRTSMRLPDSLPHPDAAMGTDMLPEIDHVVVLMMENHSYDNFFGMLGRGPGQTPRGDGFTIGSDGYPTATNPYPSGTAQRAFRMPTTCQLSGAPTQEWVECHIQYAQGTNTGFVISGSGAVAMGYWDQQDLPFT
jgi:phospholipase C